MATQEDPNSGRRAFDLQMSHSLTTLTSDVQHLRATVEPLPDALRTIAVVQERIASAIEATHRVEDNNRTIETRLGKIEEEVNRNCALCDRLWSVTQWAAIALVGALGTGLWWFIQKHLERGV